MRTERKSKILYFDIDGTLLCNSQPKTALANGAFERSVRDAGFDQLVCVGNIVTVIHFLHSIKERMDGLKLVFETCRGTFTDWEWFSTITKLVQDSEHRAHHINFALDWYYSDDMAEVFMIKEGMTKVFSRELNKRILVPDSDGNGSDILRWLSED